MLQTPLNVPIGTCACPSPVLWEDGVQVAQSWARPDAYHAVLLFTLVSGERNLGILYPKKSMEHLEHRSIFGRRNRQFLDFEG